MRAASQDAPATGELWQSPTPQRTLHDWGRAGDSLVVDGVVRLNGGAYETALAHLEQVIASYPETAASVVALEKKSRLLGNLKRYEEAMPALTAVLDALRPASSGSEFFQTARIGLKHLLADWINRDLYAHTKPPPERWAQLRTLCEEIAEQDGRPDERAQAQMTLAESFAWQRRYAESGAIAEAFLAQHDPKVFPTQTTWAHFYAALADQAAGRYESSYMHLRWITDSSKLDPRSPFGKQILPHAYHRICWGLKLSRAPEAAIAAVMQEYAAKFPEDAAGTTNWRLPRGAK